MFQEKESDKKYAVKAIDTRNLNNIQDFLCLNQMTYHLFYRILLLKKKEEEMELEASRDNNVAEWRSKGIPLYQQAFFNRALVI
mgnify:CR=1 FL=1